MLLHEFNKKYGLIDSHIHVRIGEGAIPRSVLTKIGRDHLYVDESYFIKRIEFRKKVKNYIQDMYFLISRVSSDMRLADTFGVHRVYFNHSIWNSYDHHSILNFRINKSDWKVFKKMRRLHRNIHRLGVYFNIEEILDMEANICREKEEYSKLIHLIQNQEMQSLLASG